MWGLSTQPVEASSSLDKLSSGSGDVAFDQLYHSGRSIGHSSEVDGLRQLFNPGQSQMSLGNSVVNSLYGGGGVGNHFPSSLPSSSSIPVSSHRSPDGSTLMSYPIAGTAISGTAAERGDAVLDGYMLGGGSIGGGGGGVLGGPPSGLMAPCSTAADQMIRSYHCRLCKQEFENKSDMQNHSKELHRTEEKTHKCIHCLKSFPTSQQLGQHSLVHSNLRKYPCAYCDKAFKQLSHVQQHQRIHTGERPYKCIVDGCTKAFRQLSSLQQHLKGHNLPLTNKSYPPPHSSSSSLSPVSSGSEIAAAAAIANKFKKTALPRPHDLTCQVCEKRCGDDELFFQHIHKHHPDFWRVLSGGLPLSDFVEPPELRSAKTKKFTCSICNKRYAHETGFAKHLASHPASATPDASAGNQLFNCLVCRKMFTKDVHLHRHLEMKTDPGHCAALADLKKKSAVVGFGAFGNPGAGHGGLGGGGGLSLNRDATSSDDMCPTIDPDSSSKSRNAFRVHGQGYPLMRNGSLEANGGGGVGGIPGESFMQTTAASARRYKYGREAEGAIGSSMHLGSNSCLSPRNSNSGSSTPDAFAYMRPFGTTSGPVTTFGDTYRKDCDAAFRSYPFAFGSHLNQDFGGVGGGHSRGPYAPQNFFCQRPPPGIDGAERRHSPPDSRHSYFPSSYLPHSQSGQGPLHGVISQPPFVHPSVETARFDGASAAGLLDPYLPRTGFSDHEMATALHQLARSIPGFI